VPRKWGGMFVIGGLILGALGGGYTAKRRGGKPADIAQYAAVYGILFGILGLFVTLVLDRMLRG
jgi:prolipoprotein diacylglyceryltransferase